MPLHRGVSFKSHLNLLGKVEILHHGSVGLGQAGVVDREREAEKALYDQPAARKHARFPLLGWER